MIFSQNMTDKLEISPATVTAAATATALIDTLGADYATVRVLIANIAQATIASADGVTVSLGSLDDTNLSNSVTVVANRTGIKFGREVRYEVDCKTQKRYLYLKVSPGTSGVTNDHVVVAAVSTLSRKENTPTSIAAGTAASNDAVIIV